MADIYQYTCPTGSASVYTATNLGQFPPRGTPIPGNVYRDHRWIYIITEHPEGEADDGRQELELYYEFPDRRALIAGSRCQRGLAVIHLHILYEWPESGDHIMRIGYDDHHSFEQIPGTKRFWKRFDDTLINSVQTLISAFFTAMHALTDGLIFGELEDGESKRMGIDWDKLGLKLEQRDVEGMRTYVPSAPETLQQTLCREAEEKRQLACIPEDQPPQARHRKRRLPIQFGTGFRTAAKKKLRNRPSWLFRSKYKAPTIPPPVQVVY